MQTETLQSISLINVVADLQNDEAQTFSHNSKLLFVGISPIRCLPNSHNITTSKSTPELFISGKMDAKMVT